MAALRKPWKVGKASLLPLVLLVGWHHPSEFAFVDLQKNLIVALASPLLYTDWGWLIDSRVSERTVALFSMSRCAAELFGAT